MKPAAARCKISPFRVRALGASRKIKMKIVGATTVRSLFPLGSELSSRTAFHPVGFQPKREWFRSRHPGWGGPENCALGSGIASVPLALLDVQITFIFLCIPSFFWPNARG